MPTTTNYGWTTPADTDLVKDGAAAIRTLGSSIDTSVKSLNAGTTAGDIDYYTSSTAKARIGIGANGTVLTSNGSVPSWAVAAGSMTSIATGSLSGVETSLTSISGSYKNLYLLIQNARVSAATYLALRVNNITTSTYDTISISTNTASVNNNVGLSACAISFGAGNLDTSTTTFSEMIKIDNYASATVSKAINFSCAHTGSNLGTAWANTTAAVTSLQIRTGNGTSTFSAGTYILYGVN